MNEAHAEIITLSVRRTNTQKHENILEYIPDNVTLLPNTSGARNAEEAVRIAHLARELGCGDFVKIEIMGDTKYLQTDGILHENCGTPSLFCWYLRDCQKNTDDTGHEWSNELKNLIGSTISDRKKAIARGEKAFSESYLTEFNQKLEAVIKKGKSEYDKDQKRYGAVFENALLNRLEKYRDSYFLWVKDFSMPTTNNLSERSLRCMKSHMKISGQFENIEKADNFALIKTDIETCRRNGINEADALQKLCAGNPYTVSEIIRD